VAPAAAIPGVEPTAIPPPRRLGARDLELLEFCAEHRFVLAPQVAALLRTRTDTAQRRLRGLQRAGLLERVSVFTHDPIAYAITRAGLGVTSSRLATPRELDPGQYVHDVGVAWLGVAAHRGAFGETAEIITERRMRSEDARADRRAAPHGLSRVGAGGPGLHYPDLTVVTAGGRRVAFELELHLKGRARRERILAAYACDRRHDAVVYLVASEHDRQALLRSARRVGLDDRLHVQRLTWPDGRRPGTAPLRHPTRARPGPRRTLAR
jgi:hypothetical protein